MEYLFVTLSRHEKTLSIHGPVSDHVRTAVADAVAPYHVGVDVVTHAAGRVAAGPPRGESARPSDVRCVLRDGERVLLETDLATLLAPLRRYSPSLRPSDHRAGDDARPSALDPNGPETTDPTPETTDLCPETTDPTGTDASVDRETPTVAQLLDSAGLEPSVCVFRDRPLSALLDLSRELARRAARRGGGTYLGGVQWLSSLADTDANARTLHRRLANAGVEVTVCGVPDHSLDAAGLPFDVVEDSGGAFEEYWFSLYDGATADTSKGLVVARQRLDGGFEGYWSYDPDTVDRAFARLPDRHPWLAQAALESYC